ncbi:hypothetical protein [Lysinibacillus fusiformis]|uniref:hypothetical protein n=1 Tax=Lysinibacillus fusiformis TaxID=28031 RepID=UPI003D029379
MNFEHWIHSFAEAQSIAHAMLTYLYDGQFHLITTEILIDYLCNMSEANQVEVKEILEDIEGQKEKIYIFLRLTAERYLQEIL